MICLTLTERTIEKNLLTCQKNEKMVDAVELRVDLLDDSETVEKILRFPMLCKKPVILTCRKTKDGGMFERGERARLALMRKLVRGNFSYVDLEEDLVNCELADLAREQGIEVIRSFHDMTAVPNDLVKRMAKIAMNGEIPKAAVMPQSFDDTIRIFEAAEKLSYIKKKILLGMGSFGVPTRILYRLTGSILTFCADNGNKPAAPGQLSPDKMKHLYRADKVSRSTAIYGIIGNPVMHTASPGIHNPGFHRLGLNAIYVPFHVDSVRSFFSFAEKYGVQGVSVTVPHKQDVLPYLGTISREVKQIGSCNTVVRNNNYWKGINTDYYGFLHPIQEVLESGAIRNVLVVGAGGAARSAVWGLRNFGCAVTIVNRTKSRAEKLANATGSSVIGIDELNKGIESSRQFDLIVQTTSVGMEPDVKGDPIPGYTFTGEEIAYDIIYKPRMTKFLTRASSAGCRIVYGYEMLYEQGLLQFKSFTGFDYPQE